MNKFILFEFFLSDILIQFYVLKIYKAYSKFLFYFEKFVFVLKNNK